MSDELQFDKAEYEPADAAEATTCASCSTTLGGGDSYFLANGAMVCPNCREAIGDMLRRGSGPARLAKATGLGLLGGLVGAGIYFAILKLTGYEIGLVAIVVGFLVGAGVRMGSEGRGGRIYQLLALGITYLAIVSTYVPFILEGFDELNAEDVQAAAADGAYVPRVTLLRDETILLDGAQVTMEELRAALAELGNSSQTVFYHREGIGNEEPPPVAEEVADAIDEAGLIRTNFVDPEFTEPMTVLAGVQGAGAGGVFLLGVTVFVFAAVAPFLGLPGNLIGLLIIGFALYQAWTMNRRAKLEIEGPFSIAGAASALGATE